MPVIDIKAAPEWIDSLGPRWVAAAERGLLSAAQRGVQMIVGKIIPSRTPQPVDRNAYSAGWRATPEPGGATIENIEEHADFIEYGVRAENVKVGTAMLRALASWAERKGIAAKGGGMRTAWAIATNMKKRGIFNRNGIQGLRILAELIEKPENLPALMQEEIEREIARETGG